MKRGGMQLWADRQNSLANAGEQEQAVSKRLRSRTQPCRHPVRTSVSQQECDLKKDEAGYPDGGRAAKKRKKPLAHDRFNQKKKKASQKNRDGVQNDEKRHEPIKIARRYSSPVPSLRQSRPSCSCSAALSRFMIS